MTVGLCGCAMSAAVSVDQYLAHGDALRMNEPPEGKGLIIVFRKPKIAAMGMPLMVFRDSIKIGTLKNCRQLRFAAEPGKRVLKVAQNAMIPPGRRI